MANNQVLGRSLVLRTTVRLSQQYPPILRYMGFECLNMVKLGAIPLPLACALEVQYLRDTV